jgi:tetratricopeptide (TPR) repeat protein
MGRSSGWRAIAEPASCVERMTTILPIDDVNTDSTNRNRQCPTCGRRLGWSRLIRGWGGVDGGCGTLLQLDPRRQNISLLIWLIYCDQDDRAVEFLRRAIALKADDWEAYSTLAYVELSRRNDRAAVDAGETALRYNDVDAQAFNNLAWIYATTKNEQLRDLAKAEVYAQKAVTLTRCQQKDYLDTLAEVYRRNGRAEPAADVASASGLCARAAFASATTRGR